MIYQTSAPLVPFSEAEPETREAFLEGLTRRGIDGNPEVWHCQACGEEIAGEDILVSYNVPTPIPYCTTKPGPFAACPGYGPSLVPAPAGDAEQA